MQLITVKIDKPETTNFILGQSHFIKTVEDVHEALITAVPGIRFGLAFCEASGKCLVRWSGTDSGLEDLARRNALAIGAGHSFIVVLGDGFYPINVLNTIKAVPEVCRIFCATANPTEVVLADTEDTWSQLLPGYKIDYQPPTLVLFSEMVRSECGGASAASGPGCGPGSACRSWEG